MPCCVCTSPCSWCCLDENYSRIEFINNSNGRILPSKSGRSSAPQLEEVRALIATQSNCGLVCGFVGLVYQSPLCLTISFLMNFYPNRRISKELSKKQLTMKQCVVCNSFLCVDIADPMTTTRVVEVAPMPAAAPVAEAVIVQAQPRQPGDKEDLRMAAPA